MFTSKRCAAQNTQHINKREICVHKINWTNSSEISVFRKRILFMEILQRIIDKFSNKISYTFRVIILLVKKKKKNGKKIAENKQIQCGSVTQSCPTLCDPRHFSMPGLPVHRQLPELTQTHVHWVGDAIQPSHPL